MTNQDEAIRELENQLLKTEWKKEAAQIPLDTVNPEEQNVLIKCLNEDELNDTELATLKLTLAKYREAIEKQNPDEIIENVKTNIQLVEDEKTFLKLLDEDQQTKIVTMYYPTTNGELKIVLDVEPITDSTAILDLTENLNLFKDLTDEEINIYNEYKNNDNPNLTREEKIIAENVNQKINKLTQEKQYDIMIEFLAHQTHMHGKNTPYEVMKKIYTKMQIAYVALLCRNGTGVSSG